jgi:hypothetical protein
MSCRNSLQAVIQGFLPGIVLKIFLILLPTILMAMSKIEGHTSLSGLDRKTAMKYYIFLFVNVFLGSVITGTAFQQLDNFIHQSANKYAELKYHFLHYDSFGQICYLPNRCIILFYAIFTCVTSRIPEVIGESIPMKATFFMTYIMVDGWSGVAAEVLRLKALVIFHIKNAFLVRTEHDREQAMDPGSLDFYNSEPRLQLYFLLGLVYAVVTPMLLPFIIVFFSLAYLVFRHQVLLCLSLITIMFVGILFTFHKKQQLCVKKKQQLLLTTLPTFHLILQVPYSIIDLL